jgi:hypothetical protein
MVQRTVRHFYVVRLGITAERIRDKIAASKKKGFWMGATLPLGKTNANGPDVLGHQRSLLADDTACHFRRPTRLKLDTGQAK